MTDSMLCDPFASDRLQPKRWSYLGFMDDPNQRVSILYVECSFSYCHFIVRDTASKA